MPSILPQGCGRCNRFQPDRLSRRNELLSIPSRHLGLWTAEELADDSSLANAARRRGRIDPGPRSTDRASPAYPDFPRRPARRVPGPGERSQVKIRVGLARDPAFCFYYEDNLDQLRAAGAEIVPFSPLQDPELPPGVELVYLGGGYPEIHAARLAANLEMRGDPEFSCRRGTILAECGGLMACTELLARPRREGSSLWGLIPARAVMQSKLAALGYVSVVAERDTVLGPEGTTVRARVSLFATRAIRLAALCHELESTGSRVEAGRNPGRRLTGRIRPSAFRVQRAYRHQSPRIRSNLVVRLPLIRN